MLYVPKGKIVRTCAGQYGKLSVSDLIRHYVSAGAFVAEERPRRPWRDWAFFMKTRGPAKSEFLSGNRPKLTLRMRAGEKVFASASNESMVYGLSRAAMNMRALESNVLPFADAGEFPYSIILDFRGAVLELAVHEDLLAVLGFRGLPWSLNEKYKVLTIGLSQFNSKLTQVLGTARGFAYFIQNATSLQCAAHTHYCCLIDGGDETEEKKKTLAKQLESARHASMIELHFVPAVYELRGKREFGKNGYEKPAHVFDD